MPEDKSADTFIPKKVEDEVVESLMDNDFGP